MSDTTKLTAAERVYAQRLGMTPERYAALRDVVAGGRVRTIDDYMAVRRQLDEQDAARVEARRQQMVDKERAALEGSST